jgi:hypothetical protein
MSIRVFCPICDKAYQVDDDLEGKSIRCRDCDTTLRVSSAARQDEIDDEPPARDDRIGTRGSSAHGRREEDDERRPREAGRGRDRDQEDERDWLRRSRSSREADPGKRSNTLMLVLISLGVGALVLLGVVAAGIFLLVRAVNNANSAVATNQNPGWMGPGMRGGNPAANDIRFDGDVHSFVRDSVQNQRLTDVDIRGFELGNPYRDIAPDGGILIGFQVGLGKPFAREQVQSLRPIFLTSQGEKFGKWQGPVLPNPITVKAKPGYVVSGLTVHGALHIGALTVIFARLGKDRIDFGDSYTSETIGSTRNGPDRLSPVGNKGALFVGVTGHLDHHDGSPVSIGLVAVLPK